MRNAVLQRLLCRFWRPLAPEPIDQQVRGDDTVRTQEQEREERPLPPGRDLDLARVATDLDRTQDRKPQHFATSNTLHRQGEGRAPHHRAGPRTAPSRPYVQADRLTPVGGPT